jgi:hypothetical protein
MIKLREAEETADETDDENAEIVDATETEILQNLQMRSRALSPSSLQGKTSSISETISAGRQGGNKLLCPSPPLAC